jgi:hypothetical protein
MTKTQVSPNPATRIDLCSERLGPLPLINHFLQRMRLEEFLERHVPTTDRRCLVPHCSFQVRAFKLTISDGQQFVSATGLANSLLCSVDSDPHLF